MSGAQKVARPRDGASCSLRCAVMPTLCSGAAPPVVVTPAPTVGWDGHIDAISSGSCGRRCPLSPSCPTPSATGAVALIALLCACADGGARDGRAAAAWPRGQKLCDAGQLEEAESTAKRACPLQQNPWNAGGPTVPGGAEDTQGLLRCRAEPRSRSPPC